MRETVVRYFSEPDFPSYFIFLLIPEHALPLQSGENDVVRLGYEHIRLSPHVRWKVEPHRIYDLFHGLPPLVSIIKDYAR
jgi:hypothetical protein